MHTPGRCTNTETCWVGNAGRTVRVVLGADFVCPACRQPLRPPALGRFTSGRTARSLATGAVFVLVFTTLGFAAAGIMGNKAVNRIAVRTTGHNLDLAGLIPARLSATQATLDIDVPPQVTSPKPEALLEPTVRRGPAGEVMDTPTPTNAQPSAPQPARVRHYWMQTVKVPSWPLHGRDWAADAPPPEPAEPGQPEAVAEPDDLPVAEVAEADPATNSAASAVHGRYLKRPHLPDALRVALSARTEHVTLPVDAAPALPRYPALFAQEYPVGRVSAVCLLASRGAQPDCKVLGTGTSLTITQSVGAWPTAGKVHYRAIAANARVAASAWKPDHTHS